MRPGHDSEESDDAYPELPEYSSMPKSWKPPPSIPGLFTPLEDDSDSVPTDHTLPEFLMQVSGSSDLKTVKKLRLRLPPRHSSLTRVSACLPGLRCLTLDGSCIGTLRHLGLGLIGLRELSVVRCGLDSLDGLFGLPALRRLWAGYNQIDDVASLTALRKLRTADLRSNLVSDVEYVGFLHVCCPQLTELVLADNPCADDPDYRMRVRALLPRLVLLDGNILPEFTGEISSDEGKDFVLDDDDAEEADDDDGEEENDDDSSWRSNPEFGDDSAQAERLWSNLNTQLSDSESQNASRSLKPPTARSYDEGPLAPAPARVKKTVPYGWPMTPEGESFASPLTSGGIVCGNLSAALRNRSRRGSRGQDTSAGSGETKRKPPVEKPKQVNLKKKSPVERKGI